MIVSAMTDVGRARTTNEDAFSITDLASGTTLEATGTEYAIDIQDRGVLLALSDGMGGAQAGEIASALVLDSLQRAMSRDARGAIHEQLESAVQRANRNVFEEAKSENKHGMGATLTALFVRGDEAYIAEVGDSRGYLLRNGRLRQVTRDQSMVQMLVDQGVMSKEDARRAPGKNVILQAVGLAPDVRVAIGKLELRRGDRLLLCSDGVTNQINDDELREILTRSEPRAACETMIALANDRGGEDNETVIVADVLGEELPEVDEYETVTSTFEILQAFEARPSGKPRRRQGIPIDGASSVSDQFTPREGSLPPRSPAVVIEEPTPMLDKPPEPPAVEAAPPPDDDDVEIEISGPTEVPEPPAGASGSQPATQRSGGWISSLIGRLSRGDKPKK
jgi:serine/threonine protein phosphatase PrpC